MTGVGSDIKWCDKAHGGKRCLMCRHYADFDEWSTKWHWHYLIRWNEYHYFCADYAHSKRSWRPTAYGDQIPWPYKIKPVRYRSRGLKERDFKQLLRVGCKSNRKCRCVSVAQRGSWYCPNCWFLLNRLAQHRMVDVHEVIIADHDEMKTEMLTLQLAGIF